MSPKWSYCCFLHRSFSDKGSAIKYLNFANKALFGGVVAKKPLISSKVPSIQEPTHSSKYVVDNQSEMYWMLQHQPSSVAPPRRKRTVGSKNKKATKRQPPSSIVEPVKAAQEISIKSKKIKRSSISTPKVLAEFSDSLCKPPVKQQPFKGNATMKTGCLDDNFRGILSVPAFGLVDSNSEELGHYIGANRLDIKQMPSVGKVLQATMPEASRRALMQWKLLKIAELGEEGFNELQQCK